MNTQEGRKLPVMHCIKGTPGWELDAQVAAAAQARCDIEAAEASKAAAAAGLDMEVDIEPNFIDKPTFGSIALMGLLETYNTDEPLESVTVIGLCTDICVISNAMLFKANMPEVPIIVDSAACAGVTPESHETALAAMRACQIEVI